MKAYRYNAKQREHRKFNNCGREKNPNGIRFYASTLEHAEAYKHTHTTDGDNWYECELEVVEIAEDTKLFQMDVCFAQLATYKNYISSTIRKEQESYERYLMNAKTRKDMKLWTRLLNELEGREQELRSTLRGEEFQFLSDYERQNELVSELKSMGYVGYTTKNEIAIF